jgi:hypothetical protein
MLHREDGMPVSTLSLFQYSPTDGTWTPIPGFEGQLSANYWKEIFPPDAVCWWAVGWQNGEIVYYTWVQENACTGEIMMPGVIGELPGPPGPPGPATSFPMGYIETFEMILSSGETNTFDVGTVSPTVDSVLISVISGNYTSDTAPADPDQPNCLTINARVLGSQAENPWQVTGDSSYDAVSFTSTFIFSVPANSVPIQLQYQVAATLGDATINPLNVVWQLIPVSLLTVSQYVPPI